MALRNHVSVLLLGIEDVVGTLQTLTAGSHSVKCENPKMVFSPEMEQTNEVTASLDTDESIVGGMKARLTFDVYMVGSGTPETPPDWAVALRACAWAQTITATAVPASAEACGTGASAVQALLGSAATGTADLYAGMPISFSGNQVLDSFIPSYSAGKVAVLTDTAGGNITSTSNYQIPKNVRWAPATSSIPAVSAWLYKDGKLYKATGFRGDFTFQLVNAKTGKFSFTMDGIFVSIEDATMVTPTYMPNATKPIWRGGKSRLDRKVVKVNSLTLNNGNAPGYLDNPESAEGFDAPEHNRRTMTASIDPYETLKATQDFFSSLRDGTKLQAHFRFGSTAGNRFGITMPSAKLTKNDQSGDRDGKAVEMIDMQLTGADKGAFITQY